MKYYYSNCLFEAVKYKLKNSKIKIIYISPALNDVKNIHFLWTDYINVYDFHTDAELKWYKTLLYKGYIRQNSIHSFNAWKRNRKKEVINENKN